jgi:hypothetical protein
MPGGGLPGFFATIRFGGGDFLLRSYLLHRLLSRSKAFFDCNLWLRSNKPQNPNWTRINADKAKNHKPGFLESGLSANAKHQIFIRVQFRFCVLPIKGFTAL